jgi:L-ascorbate metabolism protein UlaG (beta-lactamase superfamily)
MKIKHYLYNCFTIEDESTKIAIDPGIHMKLFNMKSLIPENEWNSFSHVIVTHGDPDHYAKADLIANASHAPLICGKGLSKIIDNRIHLVHPRKGGIKSWIPFDQAITMEVGEKRNFNNLTIEAIRSVHGRISVSILGFNFSKTPGPNERTGMGAMGFKISINGKTIVNLGDSLLQKEWKGLKPDVLMLPIGGLGDNIWTMNVRDAIEAVALINPHLVIPCHYNVPFLIKKNAAPADEFEFQIQVEQLGIKCKLMYNNDQISI